METKHTEDEVLKLGRTQYANVGFTQDDGTKSLYCSGVRFGYMQALDRSNAIELLNALNEIKRLYGDRTDYIGEYKTAWEQVDIAIKKATE